MTRHGDTRGPKRTPEYISWAHLKQRCLNPNHHKYALYGGRGIKVCPEWLDYINFLNDMGRKPGEDYSIDRINGNGNYEPLNCRWATMHEQRINRTKNKFTGLH
jgi:hypothetical protein